MEKSSRKFERKNLIMSLPVFSSDTELTTAEVFACQLIKDWQIASEKEGIPEMPLNFFLKRCDKNKGFSH